MLEIDGTNTNDSIAKILLLLNSNFSLCIGLHSYLYQEMFV